MNITIGTAGEKIGDLASPPLSNGSGQNPLNIDITNIRTYLYNPKIIRDCLKEIAQESSELAPLQEIGQFLHMHRGFRS